MTGFRDKEVEFKDHESETQIVRNSVHCFTCGQDIESTHVHDFTECRGGHVFVDGGHEYLRRGFMTGFSDYEDTSIIEPWPILVGGERMPLRTHGSYQCAGGYCTIHRPSLHPLSDFPQHWGAGYIERVCPHGVGFIDPDEVRLPQTWVRMCQECGISQDAKEGTVERMDPRPWPVTRTNP